jgi:hypothetical protein
MYNIYTFCDTRWPEDDHECVKLVALLLRLIETDVNKRSVRARSGASTAKLLRTALF